MWKFHIPQERFGVAAAKSSKPENTSIEIDRQDAKNAVQNFIRCITQRIRKGFSRIAGNIMWITANRRFIELRIDRSLGTERIGLGMKKLSHLKEDALFVELKRQPMVKNSSMSIIITIAAPKRKLPAINVDAVSYVVAAIQLLSEWKLYPTGQRMLYPILESTGWN